MSAHLQERLEKLEEIIKHLAEEASKGTPLVVEGKKDIEALTALGVQGKIIAAKSGGKSLLDVIYEIEDAGTREVVLLFDFDRRGKEWTKRLMRLLEPKRITSSTFFWRRLLALVGKEVKDVEGLASYMETLKGKVSSNS